MLAGTTPSSNGKLTDAQIRAAELRILDATDLPALSTDELERLAKDDPGAIQKCDEKLYCEGPPTCSPERLCWNCVSRRRYLWLCLHRLEHGRARHPSEQAEAQPPSELGIILSTVTPSAVSWLWPGRIPLGKLSILDGDPGLGKSVLSLDLAARVSQGIAMPCGAPCQAAGVVILTAEDGLDDTVVPRLEAAGADRSRILALDKVPALEPVGTMRPPSIPQDVRFIRDAIRRVDAALVIVDPLMAYLVDVNAHRDTEVRQALWPLAEIAEQTGAAVLVIRHLNKAGAGSPIYRGGGSIGIIGAARSGLLVAQDPDNPDRRILASTKCNLAKLPEALIYGLDTAPNGALRVGWKGKSAHTAESLLAAPRDDEDRSAIDNAADVLRSVLADGPLSKKEVEKEARAAGISEKTLARAKALVGIKPRKVGFGAGAVWKWFLPSQSP
ncbi:MAG: AAA family ATPase [Planctomycetes bacterium]|nr:AAA family ATPase [Planctomycetota bacterium]